MSSPSSLTMCTSTDDCFCHEHVRQSFSPSSAYAQRRASSAGIASRSGSCRLGIAKQHLLQRVAAQAEAQRLERDDLVRRDVPEIDVRAEALDEPSLRRLRRRLEDQVLNRDLVRDLLQQAGAHVAVLAEDSRGPALARLGDHLDCTGLELLLDPRDPLYGAKTTSESLDPTSDRTVKSRAKSSISSSLRSRGISIEPSEI